MTDTQQTAFDIASRMEDDLVAIAALGRATFQMSLTLGEHYLRDDDTAALALLATLTTERSNALQDRLGELCRALHPQRAHFEKVGWPADKAA